MSLPTPEYQIKMLAIKKIYPAAFLGHVSLENSQRIMNTVPRAKQNIYKIYMHPFPLKDKITKSKIANHKQ